MIGFVYILSSIKNGQFYIGSTVNFQNRIIRHNKGLVEATRNFRPYRLELLQQYPTLTKAKQIEYRIKQLKRRDYIEKMIKDGFIKMK